MTTAQAAQQAITIAERLLDPAAVLAAVPARPATSLQSLAGTALLHARLARASPAFEAAAHAHWTAAATHTPRPNGTSPGLFTAPAGMAASLILAENYLTNPEPQQPAVRQAVRWLAARTVAKATAHHDHLHAGTAPPSWALYRTRPPAARTRTDTRTTRCLVLRLPRHQQRPHRRQPSAQRPPTRPGRRHRHHGPGRPPR